MLRERVDIFGKVRPMEPKEDIAALQLKPQSIGIIKEAPVVRWLAGQEKWDKKYKHKAHKVIKQRCKYEDKAERLLQHAFAQGVIHDGASRPVVNGSQSHRSMASAASGTIDQDRRWGECSRMVSWHFSPVGQAPWTCSMRCLPQVRSPGGGTR